MLIYFNFFLILGLIIQSCLLIKSICLEMIKGKKKAKDREIDSVSRRSSFQVFSS